MSLKIYCISHTHTHVLLTGYLYDLDHYAGGAWGECHATCVPKLARCPTQI